MAQKSYICAMNKEDIGAVLKQIRLDEGLTIVEVAFELYTTKQTIGNIESGRNAPKSYFLSKMLKLYGKHMIIESDDNMLRCEVSDVESFALAMKAIREHFGYSRNKFEEFTHISRKRIQHAEECGQIETTYLHRLTELFPITITIE